MSWSVGALGKPSAVKASLAKQFEKGKCIEPEETIRQSARAIIEATLDATDPARVVKVLAGGIQGYDNYTEKKGIHNSLQIQITPEHGFVE